MPHKLIRNLLILGSLTRTSAFVSTRRRSEYTAPNNTGALLPFSLFTCCPENAVRHAPRGQGHRQLAQVFLSSVCLCRMLSLQPNTGSIFGRGRRCSRNTPCPRSGPSVAKSRPAAGRGVLRYRTSSAASATPRHWENVISLLLLD